MTRKTRTPRKREFDLGDLLASIARGLDELRCGQDRLYRLYDRRIARLEALCGVGPKRKRKSR